MAFLSPGVFLEEVPSEIQVISGVSASIGAFLGFSPRGPVNDPTLVTSFGQYTRVFGPLTKDSYMPLSVAAFFANGGQNAYITRVVPSDAVAADSIVSSITTDQDLFTGDGSKTSFADDDTVPGPNSVLKVNTGASPIVASSVTAKWRVAGTPATDDPTMQRDGTTPLLGDTGETMYEGRVDPASIIAVYSGLSVIAPVLTTTIKWDLAGASSVLLNTLSADKTKLSGTGPDGTATLDLTTGFFTLEMTAAATTVDAITIDFTPAVAATASDDGAGAWTVTADISGAGAISYTAGTYTLLPALAPLNGMPILITYTIAAWDLNPVSAGTWGNGLRLLISGSSDY